MAKVGRHVIKVNSMCLHFILEFASCARIIKGALFSLPPLVPPPMDTLFNNSKVLVLFKPFKKALTQIRICFKNDRFFNSHQSDINARDIILNMLDPFLTSFLWDISLTNGLTHKCALRSHCVRHLYNSLGAPKITQVGLLYIEEHLTLDFTHRGIFEKS